jgi:hypothetical protein
MTLGEEICGLYLQFIKECDFVKYNIKPGKKQEEIDVIAIDLNRKIIYVCEVATHIKGLNYGSGEKDAVYNKIITKFLAASEYSSTSYKNYQLEFMLWAPKISKDKYSNKYKQIHDAMDTLLSKNKIDVKLIVNEKYAENLSLLKNYARSKTSKFESGVMRLYQIEKSCNL